MNPRAFSVSHPQIATPNGSQLEHLVLLSGGIDSATLVALLLAEGCRVSCLHVDYDQRARVREHEAVLALSAHYRVALQLVGVSNVRANEGEIRGRNAFLIHTALLAWPATEGVVAIGVHAGTGYRDCELGFVDMMQRSFDYHTDGGLTVAVPFVAMLKGDVYRIAHALGVPVELTYSCENGDEPCLRCSSCRDREVLGASAY